MLCYDALWVVADRADEMDSGVVGFCAQLQTESKDSEPAVEGGVRKSISHAT